MAYRKLGRELDCLREEVSWKERRMMPIAVLKESNSERIGN